MERIASALPAAIAIHGKSPVPQSAPQDLEATAQEFEAAFIAEMLGHAGFGKSVSANAGFGGEAMSSMLLHEYATMLAERGDFGIANTIARQLSGRASDVE